MSGAPTSENELDRLVVIMRYADELSFEEIAAVLDLTVEDVRDAHDAAVERIRRPRRAK